MKPLRAAICAVFAICALYSLVDTIKTVASGGSYVNGLLNVVVFTAPAVGLALWKKRPSK